MQSLRKAIIKKTVKGGFGSTEVRSFVNRSKSAGDNPEPVPGPGHYNVIEKVVKSDKSFSMFGSSSFSSMSHRMITTGNEFTPGKKLDIIMSPLRVNIFLQ